MLTANLILSIIDSLLKLAVIRLEKATPEQVQAMVQRDEDRLAFFEGLLRRAMPES